MPMIIAGSPVSDTDIVTSLLDEPKYSWGPGDFGTDKREFCNKLVGHWTAGEAGTKSYDDDGAWVANVMKTRKNSKGNPLRVSIHFTIGACDPDDPGLARIWQSADPYTTACVHVGSRAVNRYSIGVEVVNMATPSRMLRSRPRKKRTEVLLGRRRPYLDFYPAQLRSWLWLADTLSGVKNDMMDIPRRLPSKDGELYTGRMSLAQLRKWEGAMEHFHMHNTNKSDAGGFLLREMIGEGWEFAEI